MEKNECGQRVTQKLNFKNIKLKNFEKLISKYKEKLSRLKKKTNFNLNFQKLKNYLKNYLKMEKNQ